MINFNDGVNDARTKRRSSDKFARESYQQRREGRAEGERAVNGGALTKPS